MFERFTAAARDVVVRAQIEARTLGAPRVGSEHVLLALVDDQSVTAAPVLARLGVRRPDLLAELGVADAAEPGGFTAEDAQALRSVGIDVDAVLQRIAQTFGDDALERVRRAGAAGRRGGHLPFGADAKETLRLTLQDAVRLRSRQLDEGNILVGAADAGGGATRLLAARGIDAATVRRAVDDARRRSA